MIINLLKPPPAFYFYRFPITEYSEFKTNNYIFNPSTSILHHVLRIKPETFFASISQTQEHFPPLLYGTNPEAI